MKENKATPLKWCDGKPFEMLRIDKEGERFSEGFIVGFGRVQIDTYREKFLEGLDICPICGRQMKEAENLLKDDVSPYAVLSKCPMCRIVVGRYN